MFLTQAAWFSRNPSTACCPAPIPRNVRMPETGPEIGSESISRLRSLAGIGQRARCAESAVDVFPCFLRLVLHLLAAPGLHDGNERLGSTFCDF